jgi:hypothetical protein
MIPAVIRDDPHPRDEVAVRTEPFTLPTPRGALRGLAHFDPAAGGSRGTVVLAPPFGITMRRGQSVALYFVFNGFDVIRYDPTNHVGVSDGDVLDLTPSSMVEDLGTVLRWAGTESRGGPLHLFASSISARLAFAMLAERGCDLAAVGTISSVVDMRRAIAAATDGDDLVGSWLAGAVRDPDRIQLVMDHQIRWRFIQDLIERDWHTPESTVRDLSRLGPVPLISVHGAKDEWVDVEQATAVFGAREQASIVVLSDAVHALNVASARTALSQIVRFFLAPRDPCTGPIAMPTIAQVLELSKLEAQLERRVGAPPFVETVYSGLPRPHGGHTRIPAT